MEDIGATAATVYADTSSPGVAKSPVKSEIRSLFDDVQGNFEELEGRLDDQAGATSGIKNFSPANMGGWLRSRLQVLNGSASKTIAFLTHSLGSQYSDNTVTGKMQQTIAARCAEFLNSGAGGPFGARARCWSFFGDQGIVIQGETYADYVESVEGSPEEQVDLDTGWAFDTADESAGGAILKNNSTTNNLILHPKVRVDGVDVDLEHNTVEVKYVIAPGLGKFTVQFDGASLSAEVDCSSGTPGMGSFTHTAGAVSAHDVKIARVSGTVKIWGAEAYDSSKKQIRCVNLGRGGAKAETFLDNTNAWSAFGAIVSNALDAALYVVLLDLNDILQGTSAADFETDLGALVDQCKTKAPVVLCVSPYMKTTSAAEATQDLIMDKVVSVGVAKDCVVLDLREYFVNWTTMVGNGFGTTDSTSTADAVHPGGFFHYEAGRVLATIIGQAVQGTILAAA